jgi:hypothetical protein
MIGLNIKIPKNEIDIFAESEDCFGLNTVILVVAKAVSCELGLYPGD